MVSGGGRWPARASEYPRFRPSRSIGSIRQGGGQSGGRPRGALGVYPDAPGGLPWACWGDVDTGDQRSSESPRLPRRPTEVTDRQRPRAASEHAVEEPGIGSDDNGNDEERRQFLARLVMAQEQERLRVARELHDELGQLLTSATLVARSLEQDLPPAQAKRLATLRQLIEEALASTRDLVRGLHPVELHELGLGPTLQGLVEDIGRRHRVRIDLHAPGLGGRLPADVETATYRIIQEAITNALRHAAPRSISIVATRGRRKITAVVEDDGRGFDLTEVMERWSPGRRMGLLGMQERARAVGGRLVVDAGPGRGTTIRIEIPLGSPGEGAATPRSGA